MSCEIVCEFYRLGFPVLTAGSVIRLCTDNGEDQSPLRGFFGGLGGGGFSLVNGGNGVSQDTRYDRSLGNGQV